MPFDHDETTIHAVLTSLGIAPETIARRSLPFCREAQSLVIAETDPTGREYLLVPEAAQAWWEMKRAAQEDNVGLEIVSAFRSIQRQIEIIRAKLDHGMPIDTILIASAPPGYSEHHTGRAVDINTPGCDPVEGVFAETEAFQWLIVNAARFGFSLSYPPDNPWGFVYEPWHWCFQHHA